MEKKMWCHVVGKHALDGLTYVRHETSGDDGLAPDGMCVKWPECKMCASGKRECVCKPKDLLEGGGS